MKSRYLVLIGILYLLSALGFIYYLNDRTNTILMDHLDRQLVTAALAADAILGKDYHTNIKDKSSKSEAEDWDAIMRLTDYARKAGMTFIYTAVRRDDMIYLTTSSASQEELDSNSYVQFFDPYPDASKKMHLAFLQKKPVFSTYTDRWGEFRAVYIQRISPDKTIYVTCAELSLERYHELLKSRTLSHTSLAIVMFSLFVVFSVTFVVFMRRKEISLTKARKAAESGIRAKDEFLAVMSHEMRTPLNGILGANSLLRESDLTPGQAELSDLVNNSGTKLLRIIDDILEFSRIEAGNAEISEARFDIFELLDRTMNMTAFQIGDKPLSLGYVISSNVPRYLIQDEGRLHQVLVNLVGNAIKYTDEGQILVRVAFKCRDGQAYLQFDITDTGIGISSEDQGLIFDIFSQVDSTTSRKYGGTGLGLTICMRLVRAMGGEISVNSSPGNGSTFRFFVKCEPVANQIDSMAGLRKKTNKVMICLKDPFVMRCLESLLEYLGIAFEEIQPRALSHIPNGNEIWFVDQDVTSGPLQSSLAHNAIRVIVIRNGASELSQNFKMMTLPISALKLIPLLYERIENSASSMSDVSSKKNKDNVHPPLSILCADDDQMNRKIVVRMLKKMGHTAEEAQNGMEVLRACEQKNYDLILMDMQMPEMDGIEATRELKTKYGDKTPTIIALTANAFPEHRETCIGAGMDDYLAKPLDLNMLKEMILNYIPRTGHRT